MKVFFSKYQGTGNDFVMIDNRTNIYDHLTVSQIQKLCDRRFGIGADGLIKINNIAGFDFEVDYYNSDGSKSFCGNGARCSVAFADAIGINVSHTKFLGIDGPHEAKKLNNIIALEMIDVNDFQKQNDDYVIYTGSPHYVRFVANLNEQDVVSIGKEIRYSDQFKKEGINVNLVEVIDVNSLKVYTYERGVEDETLSCGTGVTACVLAYGIQEGLIGKHEVDVKVKGGELKVSFNQTSKGVFKEVHLIGPGEFVFKGEIDV